MATSRTSIPPGSAPLDAATQYAAGPGEDYDGRMMMLVHGEIVSTAKEREESTRQPFSVEQALKERDRLLADLQAERVTVVSDIANTDKLAKDLRQKRDDIDQAIRELTPRQRRTKGGEGDE